MNDRSPYVPPKIWSAETRSGGKFEGINRATAGARFERPLRVGRHPLQLYSLATPNGVKVTVMLEELLELGHREADYDAWLIDIMEGKQFSSGFVAINPNSKIPALVDTSGDQPVRIFESGAILLYLAEKFGAFLPAAGPLRAEVLSWLFWQMGTAPLLGGGFGHFFAYAPEKLEYPINRYAMEAKRQFDVLDRQLATSPYVAGEDYSIADIACWPWLGQMALGKVYAGAAEFLALDDYSNVQRWAKAIAERPAVKRGRIVNKTSGNPAQQLRERHEAEDFETRTQDRLEPRAAE